MDSRQSNKWSMYLKVKGFYKRYASTFNPLPQFPPLITELSNLINAISDEDVTIGADTSGFTVNKENIRTALEQICGKVGTAVLTFGELNGQPEILEREDYLSSALSNATDSELYVLAVQLYRAALPVQGSLGPYGSGPADVALVNTESEKFLPEIKVARNQRKAKSRAVKKMKELFSKTDALLEKSDIYLTVYRYSNQNMWSQYDGARKIDKRAGGHTLHKKHGNVLPGYMAHAAFSAEVLKAKSKLTFTNKKKGGTLQFYFAPKPNQKPGAQTKLTAVNFSKPVKIIAADAGYTVHNAHLQVFNPNAMQGVWKAEIEIK